MYNFLNLRTQNSKFDDNIATLLPYKSLKVEPIYCPLIYLYSGSAAPTLSTGLTKLGKDNIWRRDKSQPCARERLQNFKNRANYDQMDHGAGIKHYPCAGQRDTLHDSRIIKLSLRIPAPKLEVFNIKFVLLGNKYKITYFRR